jgi:hypothetical protein
MVACGVCGAAAKVKYCSTLCRGKAWRLAHADARKEQDARYVALHHGQRAVSSKRWYFGKYGLAIEEVEAMKEGGCAICGTKTIDLHVDHDHATGKVRGILCRECNIGLGKFGDSPELMLEAIAYLRTHAT